MFFPPGPDSNQWHHCVVTGGVSHHQLALCGSGIGPTTKLLAARACKPSQDVGPLGKHPMTLSHDNTDTQRAIIAASLHRQVHRGCDPHEENGEGCRCGAICTGGAPLPARFGLGIVKNFGPLKMLWLKVWFRLYLMPACEFLKSSVLLCWDRASWPCRVADNASCKRESFQLSINCIPSNQAPVRTQLDQACRLVLFFFPRTGYLSSHWLST